MSAKETGNSPPGGSLPGAMTSQKIHRTYRLAGFGDEHEKSEGEQFIEEALKWISQWLKKYTQDQLATQPPFAFLYTESAMTSHALPGAGKLAAFKSAHVLGVGGHLYASDAALRNVYGKTHAYTSATALLGSLTDFEWANYNLVVVSPADRMALCSRAGEDRDDALPVSFAEQGAAAFSFESLDEYLKTYYTHHVETHLGYNKVWRVAGKRQLKTNAEMQIQGSLASFLHFGILPLSAELEQEVHTVKGRLDIRILRAKRDQTFESAILELKVLRDTGSPDALTWAKQGVDQVVDYAKSTSHCLYKYVCLYDARKKDAAMPAGHSYAVSNEVRWRRYFMTTPGCDRVVMTFDS